MSYDQDVLVASADQGWGKVCCGLVDDADSEYKDAPTSRDTVTFWNESR